MVAEMSMQKMPAGAFKAKCLAIMDQVSGTREPVVITKNGQPVVSLMPLPLSGDDPIFGFYRGKLDIRGDVISPVYTDDEYEEFFERSAAQLG
jgi:prevent-host-death family protein